MSDERNEIVSVEEEDSQGLMLVSEFAQIIRAKRKQAAYDVLRQNPNLVVRLSERRIRVDRAKLQEWLAAGGARAAA